MVFITQSVHTGKATPNLNPESRIYLDIIEKNICIWKLFQLLKLKNISVSEGKSSEWIFSNAFTRSIFFIATLCISPKVISQKIMRVFLTLPKTLLVINNLSVKLLGPMSTSLTTEAGGGAWHRGQNPTGWGTIRKISEVAVCYANADVVTFFIYDGHRMCCSEGRDWLQKCSRI